MDCLILPHHAGIRGFVCVNYIGHIQPSCDPALFHTKPPSFHLRWLQIQTTCQLLIMQTFVLQSSIS